MRRLRVLLLLLFAAAGAALAAGGDIAARDLPPEARETLRRIDAGGPFPYRRDGVVFGNREHRLPEAPRGHYHEYTVPTPGAHDRGARRIIAGATRERYYTDDHYRTFRRIRE
jgi:ribonuclease T1